MKSLLFVILILGKSSNSKIEKSFNCDCGLGDPGARPGEVTDESQPDLPTLRKIAQGYNPHSRPWMVYILLFHAETNVSSVCGGAIINPGFILTAGHCFCSSELCREGKKLSRRCQVKKTRRPKKVFRIRDDLEIGNYVRVMFGGQINPDQAKESKVKIEQVIIHPDFDKFYNDIALIKLKTPIDFEEMGLHPICLPSNKNFNDSVYEAVVAGWGSMGDSQCTTDGKGPSKYHRCRFPYKFRTQEGEESSEYQTCTFAPPPSVKNQLCNSFYSGLHLHKPFPRFPVEIFVEGEEPVLCYNSTHGLYGWCGTFTQSEMVNLAENTQITQLEKQTNVKKGGAVKIKKPKSTTPRPAEEFEEVEIDDLITESKNWGWCQAQCQIKSQDEDDHAQDYAEKEPKATNDFKAEISSKKVSSNLRETVLQILDQKMCKKLGEYKDSTVSKVLKVKNKIEFCAAKKNVEDVPQKWEALKQKDGNFKFKFRGESEKRPNIFYGGKDACRGDSGGPIWIWDGQEGQQRAIVIGVVSRGKGCALHNIVGIYVRITAYLDWIIKIASPGKCTEDGQDIEQEMEQK